MVDHLVFSLFANGNGWCAVTENDRPDDAGLNPDEIDELNAAALPDREAMSLIDANIAIPIDPSIAANVLSDESIADVDVEEEAEPEQGT
jgi:hypothetical protein